MDVDIARILALSGTITQANSLVKFQALLNETLLARAELLQARALGTKALLAQNLIKELRLEIASILQGVDGLTESVHSSDEVSAETAQSLDIILAKVRARLDVLSETLDTLPSTSNAAILSQSQGLGLLTSTPSEGDDGPDMVKLQRLKLTPYSGDLKQFQAFWNQFETCVHNTRANPANKFVHLLSTLKGDAKKAIQGYNPTEENYPKVIKLIQQRFGDPAKLRALYYRELENLPHRKEAALQRSTFDEIKLLLNNLSAIGIPTDESHLRTLILQKFNETVLREVLRVHPLDYNTLPLDELMKSFDQAVTIEESISTLLQDVASTVKKTAKMEDNPRAVLIGGKPPTKCCFCDRPHKSQDCRTYQSHQARKSRALELRLCFLCTKSGHSSRECYRKNDRCQNCRKTGHSVPFCIQYDCANGPKNNGPKKQKSGIFLETFICAIRSAQGEVLVRGILDTGSHHSYIVEDLAKRLRLKLSKCPDLSVNAFGSLEPVSIRSRGAVVTLIATNSSEQNVSCFTTPCITGKFETSPDSEDVKEMLPAHLKYADRDIFKTNRKPIELLVGADFYHKIVQKSQKRLANGVVLLQSIFGWIPSGAANLIEPVVLPQNHSSVIAGPKKPSDTDCVTSGSFPFDLSQLETMWSLETIGIKTSSNEDSDDLVLKKFRDTVRFENGRYIVRWPWKTDNPHLPSNFRMCVARLRSLLDRTPYPVLKECQRILTEQEESNIIEKAPRNPPFLVHYLPHRPTLKNDKVRIVYDASAKTKAGLSLNDMLHKGPLILQDLVGLLLNFHLRKVGIIADIEKAFLQVQLNEVDKDVVRFLWVRDINAPPTLNNLVYYRFVRVPFGVISSPFLLAIVLQELLSSPPTSEWLSMAKTKFYVDNLVLSLKDVPSALNFRNCIINRLQSAGFNLRDWLSNDTSFLKAVTGSPIPPKEPVSLLGLGWDLGSDTISIKINSGKIPSEQVTKRETLQFLGSIYDPLGLIAPSVLDLKLLVQQCWKNKFDWDKPLPTDLLARWLKISSEAQFIPKISIPRHYWPFSGEGQHTLHIFCDASKKAFACCAYLTYCNLRTGKVSSALIYSKIRLAPIKETSIPRLELLASLIGKRTAAFLSKNLDISLACNIVIWTDATTVLQWLNATSTLPKFVHNRIVEIKSAPNLTFRYVPTDCNPADVATRGIRAELLPSQDLWWQGPSWLNHEQLWPATPDTTEIFSTPTAILAINIVKYCGVLTDTFEKRFSYWNSYVRVIRSLLKLGSLFKFGPPGFFNLDRDTQFQYAERSLIKELQRKYFALELANLRRGLQPNFQLELFLDDNQLIRCKGRLQNISFPWDTIHPILLPRDSPLTDIYIRKIHVENHHIGCNHLLAKIRERFWIVKGRAKVKSIIHRCMVCKRWSGGSYSLPPPPPLPLVRVAEASPFLHTGLDYLGPLNIKDDADNIVKGYVALFVCLVTRAVHLEPVRDLSADEFLMCLTRFAARRGVPKYIISDNAPNFVFIQPLVGKKIKTSDYKVNNYMTSNNICWHFIPQYAPWYGGAYERLVALVKNCLKRSYGSRILTYSELYTALTSIEDVLNGRPLTHVGEETLQPLTPNHFLRLRTCNASVPLEVGPAPIPSTNRDMVESWRRSQHVAQSFWAAFRSLYLLSLRERQFMRHKRPKGSVAFQPCVGHVVLIKEPIAPRADWKLGIIEEIVKRQALAHVRSRGKILLRAISQLYPLEVPLEPMVGSSRGGELSPSQSSHVV